MDRADRNPQLLDDHLAEREGIYGHAPFPLYGLPATWAGPRALGAMATTEDDEAETVDYLGVTHGPHQNDPGTARLDVITSRLGAAPTGLELLADQAGVFLPDDSASVDLTGLVTAAAGPITAITQQVTIDRSSVETRGIRAGAFWVLETDFGSHHLSVAAGNWSIDDLRLERISDLGPYFAGTRQLLSR